MENHKVYLENQSKPDYERRDDFRELVAIEALRLFFPIMKPDARFSDLADRVRGLADTLTEAIYPSS